MFLKTEIPKIQKNNIRKKMMITVIAVVIAIEVILLYIQNLINFLTFKNNIYILLHKAIA